MNRVPRVITDPDRLRSTVLRPGNIQRLILRSAEEGCPILLALSMGLGKTQALIAWVLSYLWRRNIDKIAVFVANRRQGEELLKKFQKAGIRAAMYPRVEDVGCPHEAEMIKLGDRACGSFGSREYCSHCPQASECRFVGRLKPKWVEHFDVVIVPEQLLLMVPEYLRLVGPALRWAVFNDEAQLCVPGFGSMFSRQAVERELKIARHLAHRDMVRLLTAVLEKPTGFHVHLITCGVDDWMRTAAEWQRQGLTTFGWSYRFHIQVILDYARAGQWRWYEDGQYCIHRPPYLGLAQVFMGANLQPGLIAKQYQTKKVIGVLPSVVLQHPHTRFINIQSPVGVRRRRPQYERAIINLVADVLARNHEIGAAVVLLGRKDQEDGDKFATTACEYLMQALRKRFLGQVKIVTVPEAPEEGPHPDTAVYATFGMSIGLNALEHYATAAFTHGFYVSDQALRDALYPELPPSRRPPVTIGDFRKIQLSAGEDAARYQLATELLLMMEVDPLVQAAGRTRFTIHPRTVVVSCLHDLTPLVGPHTVVKTIEQARTALGLGTTFQEQVCRVAVKLLRALRDGQTLTAWARVHGVVNSTARKIAAAFGLAFPKGRPRRSPMTNNKCAELHPKKPSRGEFGGLCSDAAGGEGSTP